MPYVPVSMRQKLQGAKTEVKPATPTVKTAGYVPVAQRKNKNKEVMDSIKKSTPFMLPSLNRILTAPAKPYLPSIPVGGTANSTQAIADKNTPDTIKTIKGTANLISGLNPLDKDVREGFVQGVPQAVSGFQQGAGNVLDTLAENAGGKSTEAKFYQKGADALKRKADENYKLGKDISTDFGAKGITPLLQDPDFSKVFFEDKEFAKRMMDKYATEEEKTGETKSFLELIQDPSVAQKMVSKNLPNLIIGAGTGLATTVATGGNVPAGVASAFAVTSTMEGGNAINEAKEFLNRHPDQAFRDLAKDEDYLKNIGTAVGIINGALEVLPIANLLKRIPAGNEVKSRVARIVLNKLIVGGITQAGLEGSTESIQELVGNAVKQVYDADQGLFEGVGEAGILGAVTGGGVSLATDVGVSGYDKSKALKAYYDTLTPKEKQGGFINFGIGLGDKSPKPKFGGFIDPRNKTEAFVTAVNGDKQVYFTVPKGQEASVIDAIDGTSDRGIAGKKMADGWTYHITANPQRVKEVYKGKGKITLGQINAIKRKSGIVLDSEMDQTQQRIVENISKDEVEQLLKRAYPFVSDFYDSFEDWMDQDSNTIDLEIESNDITLIRRSEKLRERAEVSDGKGYRGDVSLSEIIDLYKEGKLTKSTANLDAPRRTDIKTDSSVQPTLTQPFSPKTDSAVAVESLKQLYETANQRVASSNREAVQKARLDLFVQYNANPNLASDLGVTPAELNKKIRTMAGFPASGASVQRDLNEGVAPQYQWVGVSNSSYITKQSLEAKDVDVMVKKVTDKTAKWGQPDGQMLRNYILRTMFAIDTRIDYSDLTFKVESLERALGQYSNKEIEITINTGAGNTVAHEMGHYLDYKWAREIGFDNSLTELTQAGFNKQMIQERYNLSNEHMAWVESFKDFSYRLSNVSDLGRDNKSASYRQNPTETFARFVDKFVQWTNKQAGVREWAESGYYDDKFTESQFREFVTLLQEKAYLDAKDNIKYDPREGAKTSRKTKSEDSMLSEDESIQDSTTTRSEVVGYVRERIKELISNNEIDPITIKEIRVIGSRTTGKARKDSDLDVVVQYEGDMREDDLFNALNEDPMDVDGFTVDINPITETIDEFLGINKDEDTQTRKEEAPKLDPAILKKRFTELTEEEKNQVLEAGNNKGLSEELQERAFMIEQKQEAIDNSPFKQLLKYKVPNRKNLPKVFKDFRGRLTESTGFNYAQINNVKEQPYMQFMRAGDDIVAREEFQAIGVTDTEQARDGFDKWLSDREDLQQMKREFMIEKREYVEQRNINEAMVTQIRKRVRDERRGAKIEGKRIRSRQKEVKAYINALNLEPSEKRKIQGNRSIDLMKEAEYEEFLDALEKEARKIQDKRQAKNEVEFTIFDKGLSKVENLQKALKLPTITNMTAQQLRDFDELLQQYKTGDEFLTVRQIETVDNTDLKGIKTLREARERLAVDVSKVWKETVTGDDLKNIKVAPVADRIAYDADLATKNPFYALMVDEWNKAYIKAEANYYATEKKINELTKKARASRKRSIADKLIPTDKVVFQYMETPDANKAKFAKDNKMTAEELALVDFMKKDYEVKRDYLVQMEVLKHYRQDYITHIRRGFLETWKEDNLITAFKELFEQYQQDEAVFNIMDGETGNILPLEKFFKYSMKRTGGLKPTNNVASAFLSYDKQFQKKLMLDSIVPKLDIYAHSITPKNKTPKGLEMDKTIRNFMTEWVNTKKGRTTSRMALPQGSRSDIILRGLNGFLTIIDLGLNIPVGIASQFGEQISTYQALGTKGYSKGVVRLNSDKGKALVKKYESFIGRSPWEELFDSTNTIGDQTLDAMFILFRDATIRANKVFTLGALTKEEYESGEISTERLAEIRNLMSSVRVVDEAKSIYGSTSVGGVFTKYKTWAIPHLLTTRRNIINLIRQFREKGVTDIQKSPEAQQLLRMIMVTGTIALVVGSAIDEDDDSFTGKLLQKAYQDSMTQMGSLDPAVVMSVPRLLTFLEDVGTALSEIIRLEEYKSGEKKGTLKGDDKLYGVLSPVLIDQITKSVTEDNASTTDQVNQVKTKGNAGMPAVPTKKSDKKNLPPIPKSSQK